MGNNQVRIQENEKTTAGTPCNRDTNDGGTSGDQNRGMFLFYLFHRTWAIVVADNRQRAPLARVITRTNVSSTSSTTYYESDDSNSLNSNCSCSFCTDDNLSDYTSDLVHTRRVRPSGGISSSLGRVPSNTGDGIPAPRRNSTNNVNDASWLSDEDITSEKQRPPIYNPEDYALSLRKWGKKSGSTNPPNTNGMYGSKEPSLGLDPGVAKDSTLAKDYRNPMLTSGEEMSLRQFGSVSELLMKLKSDLRLAFPSFVQEFVGEPLDGVTLLLELLRGVQLSQTGGVGSGGNSPCTTGVGTAQRGGAAVQRRALLDELACLRCLAACCARHSDAVRKLARSPAGLYTLAVCIMSNVNKSRVVALQLLTLVCDPPGEGHAPVSEALSTLRLRFGEPVRFRFLVGVLSSAHQPQLVIAGLRFLNAFASSAPSATQRLYIQAELDQAGFDVDTFRKIVPMHSSWSECICIELEKWEKKKIDVDRLDIRLQDSKRQEAALRERVTILERRVQILQEEKGVLMSLEKCLKEHCSELQNEVNFLKTGKISKKHTGSKRMCNKADDSSPHEDEGISSSERSLSPDDDIQRETSVYEVFNIKNDTIINRSKNSIDEDESMTKKLTDEEETTIEEVIEELRNIINDAETEAYEKERLESEPNKKDERQKPVIQMRVESNVAFEEFNHDATIDDMNVEDEIIPTNLHPQPPKRTRSLVHIFFPKSEEPHYESGQQEIFFDDDLVYTSDDDSDSLLSISKCEQTQQQIAIKADDNRALLNTIMDARERAEEYERRRQNVNRKSIRRSESFHHLAHEVIQIKDANIKSVKHSSVDGLFIVDINSPVQSPLMKGRVKQDDSKDKKRHMWRSQIEESSGKIKSKSLDRIDEGLDSMVDIVVTSDYQTAGSKLNRSFQESGSNENSIVVLTNSDRTSINRQNSCRITQFSSVKYDERNNISRSNDKHRVFLPSYKYESNTDFSHRLILPNRVINDGFSNGSNSFTLNRGRTNVGMYSGFQQGKLVSSIPSSDYRSMSPMGSKNNQMSIGKLTDLASGLY